MTTTQDQDIARIISRIKKLTALSQHNQNQAEAESAAQAAQELISKYQISQLQLAEQQKEKIAINAVEYSARGATNPQKWERQLFNATCLSNHCRLLVYRGTTHFTIFGSPSNISLVIELFEELRQMIKDIAEAEYQRNGWGATKVAWKTSFCLGATTALYRRMMNAANAASQETAQTMALVVVHDQDVANAVTNYAPKTKKVRSKGPSSSSAYQQGYAAGQTLPTSTTRKIA